MESRSHHTSEPVVEAVCRKQRERAAFGLGKYGKTMDREDLSMVGWATHFQEEAMDAANYAERLIRGGHLLEEAIALLAPRAGEPAVGAWLLEVARNFGEMFAHPAVASCEPLFGQITRDSDVLYFRHDFEEYEENPKGPQDEYHDCQDMLRRIGWEIADPQIEHDCISGKLARYKSP